MLQHFFPPSPTPYGIIPNEKCMVRVVGSDLLIRSQELFESIQLSRTKTRRPLTSQVSCRGREKKFGLATEDYSRSEKNPMQDSIDFWNVLSMWVKSLLLWELNPKDRAKKLKKLLDICDVRSAVLCSAFLTC